MRSGAGVGEEELGEDPGPEAERRRWPAVAEVLRNGRTMAAQRVLHGGARRAALGLRRRLRGEDRGKGSQSVLKDGKPGISACGPGLTRCAGSSVEQGRWEKVAAGRTEDLTVGPSCQ